MIDYLEANVTGFQVKSPDGEATGECPLCGKRREHFYIHVGEDRKHGKWICFACGEAGDFWKLLGAIEGMTASQAKAWWIAQGRETAPPNIQKARERLRALRLRANPNKVDTALPFGFSRIKRRRPQMLVERNVSLATARMYGLGFCREGDAAGRVVFPIKCPLGRSWTARAVRERMEPKYWGGSGAGSLLYGWDVAFRDGAPSRLVVCEGPMDVLSLAQAGIPAVAIMSKSINEARASLLRRSGASLLVALDAEARTEALVVAAELGASRVVLLKSGDPGDTPPEVLVPAVRDALGRTQATCKVYRSKIKALRRRRKPLDSASIPE